MLQRLYTVIQTKIVLVISMMAWMVLGFPYSTNALIVGSISILAILILDKKYQILSCFEYRISFREIVVSIVILLYFCICFYFRYRLFEAWKQLEKLTGCPKGVLIWGGAIGLATCAFPSVLRFCQLALTCKEKPEGDDNYNVTFLRVCRRLTYVGIGCMIFFCFSKYLWVDESFSLCLIEHDYKDLIELAAKDVHPPFYYIILKAVVDLSYMMFPFSYTRIFFAKIVSVIPFVILLGVAEKYICKKYGRYVAALFEVLVLGMANFTNYSVEIRMYSMALCFVTISFLGSMEILESECSKVRHWLIFTIASVLAAYTHYYACVAVAFLYVVLLVNLIKKKRNIMIWMCASGITVVAYLPWLKILFSQLAKVSTGYWIEPIDFSTIWDYSIFVFGYYNIFPIVLVTVINFWINRESYGWKEKRAIGIGLLLPLWVTVIGLVCSYVIRPVFVARYMFAALGAFWFAVALINSKKKNYILNLCLVAYAIINIGVFVIHEAKDFERADRIYEAVEKMEQDSVIYSDSPQSALFISLITGKRVYTVPVFSEYEEKIYKNHVTEINSVAQIDASDVYCFLLAGNEQNEGEFRKMGNFYEENALVLYHYMRENRDE